MASAQISSCGRNHLKWLTEVSTEVWSLPDWAWAELGAGASLSFLVQRDRTSGTRLSTPPLFCSSFAWALVQRMTGSSGPKRRNTDWRQSTPAPAPDLPVCPPTGIDLYTEVLQISIYTFVGFIDLIFFYLLFIHHIRKSGSKLFIQTDKKKTDGLTYGQRTVSTAAWMWQVDFSSPWLLKPNKDNTQSTTLSTEVVGGCSFQSTAIGESRGYIEAAEIHWANSHCFDH